MEVVRGSPLCDDFRHLSGVPNCRCWIGNRNGQFPAIAFGLRADGIINIDGGGRIDTDEWQVTEIRARDGIFLNRFQRVIQ